MYSLFISSLVCTVVLMVYIQFLTLPAGRFVKPLDAVDHNTGDSSVTDGQEDPSKSSSIFHREAESNAQRVHSETEGMTNANLLPIMDFKDIGSNKQKVVLLIIVSTAPQRFDRRQAIRDTWWKHCNGIQVKCVFITDGFIMDHVQRDLATKERNKYNDLELQPLLGGREFGLRFLNHVKWAMAKFDFQYLLRIDDDYFLCLKRLLAELPTRPKENLVWGHFHCEVGITWIDESFMIFSHDIIHNFLSQNESTMLCHPHADQQIGLWLNNVPTKTYFHDKRLHHDPPASFAPHFVNITNVCDSYLGLHGTYVNKMRYFGENANDTAKDAHPMPNFSTLCRTTAFDHTKFSAPFRFDPKPCKDNPSWDLERKMFVGRENHKHFKNPQ